MARENNEGQTSMEGAVLHSDLLERGHALIEQAIPPELINSLIEKYAAFTDELPDPELTTLEAMIHTPEDTSKLDLDELDRSLARPPGQEWHKYMTNHPRPGKPGGYTNRSLQIEALAKVRGLELPADPKEYFHFSPYGMQGIEDVHRQNDCDVKEIPPIVRDLNVRFWKVHDLGKKALTKTCAALEETHPELLPQFVTPNDLESSPVRLLFYHPDQGKKMATGHYDKSFMTLQIAESHVGLRVLDPTNNQMKLLHRPPEQGTFFLSNSWPKAYPNSELQPTWHDVVNVDEMNEGRTMHGKNVARWAIIFFVNSQTTGIAMDKRQNHIAPQELVN